MITMEELQGYPVADDKEIRDAHNKAVSLIEHNVDEFFDCFPGATVKIIFTGKQKIQTGQRGFGPVNCGLLMRVTKTIN